MSFSKPLPHVIFELNPIRKEKRKVVSRELLGFLYQNVGPELMNKVTGVPNLVTDDGFVDEVAMFEPAVRARLAELAEVVSMLSGCRNWEEICAWLKRPHFELRGLSPVSAILQGHYNAVFPAAVGFLVDD